MGGRAGEKASNEAEKAVTEARLRRMTPEEGHIRFHHLESISLPVAAHLERSVWWIHGQR